MSEQSTREPEEIRRDIESTRVEMGDTVEALAEKADVKAQAQKKVAGIKESVVSKKDDLIGKARQSTPDSAGSAASTVTQKARENPMPVAVAGAFAAGLLIGWMANR